LRGAEFFVDHPNRPIYLGYNATTPHAPEVIAAMRPYLEEHFGNPSSSHWHGRRAREAVERSCSPVAALLNCAPGEVIFTSGDRVEQSCAWFLMYSRQCAFRRSGRGEHSDSPRDE
jgi:cysteine sulfinate desulfinase/cysteine desulfurase-like protein